MSSTYKSGSLTLAGTVAMGTGVMIGAGIFALTGQVAEFAGSLFPLAFLVAAIVSAFSAYSYIKMSNAYPSAGGIAMILQKAYGPRTITGAAALLMAFSMIINESLVARTFATYTLQIFDRDPLDYWVPVLAAGLIVAAFLVNISGNKLISRISIAAAFLKIGGIVAFAFAALWASSSGAIAPLQPVSNEQNTITGFVAGIALAILAYKGFTTITNSGSEVQDPHKNVGRAIVISLAICTIVYMLVSYAVGSNLTIEQIVAAKDYSLAESARPSLGMYGVWFTVFVAVIATASGLLASIFAVSRMLAMLTDMNLIPHRHFGMPGDIQKHTLVYTVVLAATLAIFFDLSRIASLGVIFYLVMDMIVHWGVYRHMADEIAANRAVVLAALVFDGVALTIFGSLKFLSDPLIIVFGLVGLFATFAFEALYLQKLRTTPHEQHTHSERH